MLKSTPGFGVRYSTSVFFAAVLITFIFRINLICHVELAVLPLFVVSSFCLAFLIATRLLHDKYLNRIHVLFIVFTLFSQTYWMSYFQWSADNQPILEDQSWSDYRAGKSLAFIFYVPATFFIQLFWGLLYDLAKNAKRIN